MIDPRGAVVCVTGGARGIGRATAAELRHRGARVWIGDIDEAEAARTAKEIGCRSAHLDVTDADSFSHFLTLAAADRPVEMLVNNAGIMRMGSFVEQSLEGHHREVAINLVGVINGMHLVLPGMLERDHGHIVNVASMAAKVTTPGIATYCATKFAVAALSRAVRAELSGTGVSITTVMPAAVKTELTSGVSLDLQPVLEPGEVAKAIADTARHPAREITIPRWLAPFGTIEQAAPEPILEAVKRLVTRNRTPGDFDAVGRRAYTDRISG
jgi:short-subunit dehydrogenase